MYVLERRRESLPFANDLELCELNARVHGGHDGPCTRAFSSHNSKPLANGRDPRLRSNCTALMKGYGSIPYGARRDAKGTGHGDARRGTRRGTRQARRTAGGSVSGSLGPIERSGGSEAAEAAWAAQSGPAVAAGG